MAAFREVAYPRKMLFMFLHRKGKRTTWFADGSVPALDFCVECDVEKTFRVFAPASRPRVIIPSSMVMPCRWHLTLKLPVSCDLSPTLCLPEFDPPSEFDIGPGQNPALLCSLSLE